jgi:hypothetical protein
LKKGGNMPEQIKNFTGTFWAGMTSGFTQLMNFVPSLIGAIIILVAGWFISKFIGRIVERLLEGAKIETVAEKAHISDYLPSTEKGATPRLTAFIGGLAKWFRFLIFIQGAANVLGIVQVSAIINSIILFIPNIFAAAALVVVGAWASRYLSGLVEKSTAKMQLGNPKMPALLVRYGILGFAMIAAVSQLGVASNLINILFTGLVASLALAFGLAFGLGGQGAARDYTQSLMSKGRSYSSVLDSSVDKSISDQMTH